MNEFYLFTVLLITLPDLVTLKVCEYRDSCSCVFDDGIGMIDLASLARTDGMPLFQDQSSTADLFLYSYNPCKSFDEGTCTSVSACQYDPYLYVYYEIGSQNHVTFNVDGSNVVAIYASDDGARSTHVTLVCDTNPNSPPSVTVTGEGAQTNYYMQVTAPQLCAVPAPAGWGGGGLSGGSVLLIIFFVLVIVYIVLGAVFLKYKKQESGKGLIPNYNFWMDLPALIRDGWAFVIMLVCRQKYGYVSTK